MIYLIIIIVIVSDMIGISVVLGYVDEEIIVVIEVCRLLFL